MGKIFLEITIYCPWNADRKVDGTLTIEYDPGPAFKPNEPKEIFIKRFKRIIKEGKQQLAEKTEIKEFNIANLQQESWQCMQYLKHPDTNKLLKERGLYAFFYYAFDYFLYDSFAQEIAGYRIDHLIKLKKQGKITTYEQFMSETLKLNPAQGRLPHDENGKAILLNIQCRLSNKPYVDKLPIFPDFQGTFATDEQYFKQDFLDKFNWIDFMFRQMECYLERIIELLDVTTVDSTTISQNLAGASAQCP